LTSAHLSVEAGCSWQLAAMYFFHLEIDIRNFRSETNSVPYQQTQLLLQVSEEYSMGEQLN
jgi:hypothetical protein